MQSDEKQQGQRRIREFLRELSRTRKTEISFERNLHRSRSWHFFLRKETADTSSNRQVFLYPFIGNHYTNFIHARFSTKLSSAIYVTVWS